jgi:hypothetical protein
MSLAAKLDGIELVVRSFLAWSTQQQNTGLVQVPDTDLQSEERGPSPRRSTFVYMLYERRKTAMTAIQKTKKAREARAIQAGQRRLAAEKTTIAEKLVALDSRPGNAVKERAKLAEDDLLEDFLFDRDPA